MPRSCWRMVGIQPPLSEHSSIETKGHKASEFDLLEILVSRVQEDSPFAGDCRRGEQQSDGPPGPIHPSPERRRDSSRVLRHSGGGVVLVESPNFKLFRNL